MEAIKHEGAFFEFIIVILEMSFIFPKWPVK